MTKNSQDRILEVALRQLKNRLIREKGYDKNKPDEGKKKRLVSNYRTA